MVRDDGGVETLLARLESLPCAPPLLAAAARMGGVHLVGGAVRDLLLGREPEELDVVVEGELERLAAALGRPRATHGRFGTATIELGGCRYDLARSRAERYARPGALPEVRPAGIDEDLRRRDVTVNAIALDLADGTLRAVERAREDLDARLLRVLHERSFLDDPTRLWRVARYAARLGFALEPATAALAAEAVRGGVLDLVSGVRIGNELHLALREPDPIGALESAVALGLAPWLAPDRARASAALRVLPREGRADLVVLASSLAESHERATERLEQLGFRADERRIVLAALAAPRPSGPRASDLHAALAGLPVEAVALSPDREGAARWLAGLRDVRLQITGDDLIAAGVPRGPEVGRRLDAVLAGVLDGRIAPGRETELAAALAV
jgi:tRNA nucleotidyltransferase (CCA-adding enzyme)